MNLVKSFEFALKNEDVLSKVLPILKFINQTIPFPQKHYLINEPKIIRFLLQLHSLIPDTIDMILTSLLSIFLNSKEWIEGCCKSIEEYAQLPNQENGKYFALEFLETVITEIADLNYDIDDKCYGFIVFLQFSENEKLVRYIMKKIGQLQQQLGSKLKSSNQLNQLVEETVLKLYQEEAQKNQDENHYQNIAIELQEKGNQVRKSSKPKMSLMAMNILQSNTNLPKTSSKQQINNDLNMSDDSQKGDEVNFDQILISPKPRIDSDQAEFLEDIDTLQNLFAYITNPVAVEPSFVYATDPLMNDIQSQCEDHQYKLHVIKPCKLTTLRSYKTMLFLTDYHNHQLIMQVNKHTMQIAFRSISGFFQNSSSSGNLNHIIALLQFYLRFELKETIYNFLYFQFQLTFLDYLCNNYLYLDNPYYFDFLMRLLDPQYAKIPKELNNFTWQFLNKQGYIAHVVGQITNKSKTGINQKKRDITKEGYQFLKFINEFKYVSLEDDDQAAVIYNTSSNLDQYLGPLIPGKTTSQNKQLLGRKMILSTNLRRTSDLSSIARQINKIIIQEYIDITELNLQGKDIDRLQDVVNYFRENSTPADTPTLLSLYKAASEGMQFEKRSQRPQHTEPPINNFPHSNSIKLPQLNIQPPVIITDFQNSLTSQRKKKSITYSENSLLQLASSRRGDQFQYNSLIGLNDLQNSTTRQTIGMQTPTSQPKLFLCYPNQDNSIVDTIMKEEFSKYENINDETIAYRNSSLLKTIVSTLKQFEFHPAFDEILEDQYNLLEKIFHHFTLTQLSQFQSSFDENSSFECLQILQIILVKISKKPISEKLSKIYLTYLPRICRNLASIHKLQSDQNSSSFFIKPKYIGTIRTQTCKIIELILNNFKQKNHRIFLKLNDSATFILNEQFHQFHNSFYYEIFYQIIKSVCLYAQEKQVQAILFKANLLEGISQAFQKNVVNRVIVKGQNVEIFLIYLAYLSQLIISVYEFRDDLNQYKQSLKRLISYQKLKEIIDMYKNNKLLQQQAQEIHQCFQKKK